MFSFFFGKKLDLSTPSQFSKSITQCSKNLNKYLDKKTWIEISKKTNPRAYMEVLENHAESGNSQCQELVTQWNLIAMTKTTDESRLKFLMRRAIKFGTMAADSGIAREALNIPITSAKLIHILTKESEGKFTEEIRHLYKESYLWSVRNSKNQDLSKSEREKEAKFAQSLYAGMPELFA
jgi:hypothetical protein